MADPASLQPVPFEDRYETRQQLWLDGPHGGWLAFDCVLRREVILSIPYRSNDNERFIEAAQLRAQLRHTNLIPIYDFGVTHEGKPFFTEPSLQTLDLQQFPHDGQDEEADGVLWRRCRFLLQVCDALAFVHANELLHLELTPGNVLITRPFEEVFLVRGHPSLPAAKPRSDDPPGVLVGVPAYMAPEQAHPDRFGPPTASTDVYGLGGILYFTLYGDPPNQGYSTNPAEILESLTKRNGPPAPGSPQFTDSPSRKLAKKLESSCLRALASNRTKRQESVVEFSNEIKGILIRQAG